MGYSQHGTSNKRVLHWIVDGAPRNNARRIGRVVIARGRDAMDVAMVTSYGKLLLEQITVWADEIVPATATLDHRLR
jgi:hypothetical protein